VSSARPDHQRAYGDQHRHLPRQGQYCELVALLLLRWRMEKGGTQFPGFSTSSVSGVTRGALLLCHRPVLLTRCRCCHARAGGNPRSLDFGAGPQGRRSPCHRHFLYTRSSCCHAAPPLGSVAEMYAIVNARTGCTPSWGCTLLAGTQDVGTGCTPMRGHHIFSGESYAKVVKRQRIECIISFEMQKVRIESRPRSCSLLSMH
jgi:hypothetical protein